MRHWTRGGMWFALLLAGCAPAIPTPSPPPAAAPPSQVIHVEPIPEPKPEPPFVLEDGYRVLQLADFEAFGTEADTWTVTEEGFRCTGKPRGYLYSKDTFQNFTLKVSYRFPRPDKLPDETKFKGNTGFLVYISGEPKIWPVCLEVQGKHIQMGAIKENGGAQPPEVQDDDAARQQARKPVGQWNELEVISKDGSLQVQLNGTPVASSQPAFLSSGSIGVQAEDHPFEVRRMRIRVD